MKSSVPPYAGGGTGIKGGADEGDSHRWPDRGKENANNAPQSTVDSRLKYGSPMHRFTLGVEEEFQIVDPQTWELRSHVSELLATSVPVLGDQIKRELHQSIVEVGTRICADVSELRDEIFRIRHELVHAAERAGLAV